MAGQTYYPAIPAIAQAYQNDPRTKLAQQALDAGGSTAPVAGGKWAWASGLGRVGSGIVGAIEQKQNQRRYDDAQTQALAQNKDAVHAAIAQALGNGGGQGGQALGNGGGQGGQTLASAGGLDFSGMTGGAAGPQQGGVGVDPAAGGTQAQPAPPPPVPPQVQNNQPPPPPQATPAPEPAPTGARPATAQIAAALAGGGGAATPATPFPASSPTAPAPITSTGTPDTKVTGASLVQAMLPITATAESRGQDFGADGKPVTSPKGARFAMQVMPATARNPGFGIAPAKDNSPQEYNRVGTELLGKLTDKYGGDPAKAWAAYNCGTGRVDHALASAQKNGGDWLSKLPQETQAYVAKNCAALGNGAPQGGTPASASGGDEYQIPADQPLQPTAPQDIPGMPNAPQDRGSAKSLSLNAADKLLQTGNPFLYEQAMEMLNKGMGEQFGADQKALDVLNNRDNYGYQAGVDAHYQGVGDQRKEGYAYGREMRGYTHDDNTLHQQQAFKKSEDGTEDVWKAGQNDKDRATQIEVANINAKGKTDAASIRQQRMQQFFQTPQGAKMYGDASDVINQNSALSDKIDNFMKINDQNQNTGGLSLNTPGEAWLMRVTHPSLQQMDSLVHDIAPTIRQKGAGSMSDRDLEMFERAIPNIGMSYKVNQQRAANFKQYVSRMNDFETHKLEAAANGDNVNFLKNWTAYKNSVPVGSGKSYDEWVASIPRYDAKGNKL